MKIATILVVTLLVGGGGTVVAVATVGNVDWDQWHLFGNHHEDVKHNQVGVAFSVIHTDPQYNEEDGMYYAVTKLEAYDVSGKMIFIKPSEGRTDTQATETPEGILIRIQTGDENGKLSTVEYLIPNIHFETMTVKTRVNIQDPEYRAELIQKYGLSQYDSLGYRHHKDRGEPDCIVLTTWKDGKEVILDKNFEFKVTERTVTAAVMSDSTVFELQHIDPTEEASLNSIYTAEKVFNKIFGGDDMRVVEYIAAA